MRVQIANGGISHIDITRCNTTVTMTIPCERTIEFLDERARICGIFRGMILVANRIHVSHPDSFNRYYPTLRRAIDQLREDSVIDASKHDKIIECLEFMVEQAKERSETAAPQVKRRRTTH